MIGKIFFVFGLVLLFPVTLTIAFAKLAFPNMDHERDKARQNAAFACIMAGMGALTIGFLCLFPGAEGSELARMKAHHKNVARDE